MFQSTSGTEKRHDLISAADYVATLPDTVKNMVKTANFDSSVTRFVYLKKDFFVLQICFSTDKNGTFAYNLIGQDTAHCASAENIGLDFWKKEPVAKSNFYEFIAMRRGRCTLYYGNGQSTLKRGECALLNPNIAHRKEYMEDCSLVEICLSAEVLHRLMHSLEAYKETNTASLLRSAETGEQSAEKVALFFQPLTDTDTESLLSLLIREINEKAPGYVLLSEGYMERLFAELGNGQRYKAEVSRRKASRAELIFRDINLVIEEKGCVLTGADIQSRLGYNKDYLSRVVKRYSGMSLKEYCDYQKVKRAAKELTETDKSINEIMEELQFSGSSTFYRQFKKMYHTAPKEYRLNAETH